MHHHPVRVIQYEPLKINVHGIFEVEVEMTNTPSFIITLLKLLFGLLPVFYFTLSFYLFKGQSPGKYFLRIKVLSLYHEHIGLWHSIERSLGYFASALEFGFGFIQAFWNPNRMTLHDKIGETIVIKLPVTKTRGEKQYINMPSFAARLYDNLTSVKGVNRTFEEIAIFIESVLKSGRLLDIGTGPGRLLLEINKQIPQLELSGLDISKSMFAIAKQNLKNRTHIDLRVGNIVQTDYREDFFNCIVSSGSFYNWDKPVEGLN